ncbi:MAG TPA: type II toxin-antitoxin system HicA family toxin [Tepidiformaceae bacterium]|nr:type II toxin-antitoxin system HicA family toxin [Tepidiformaceae bacterium]
MRLTVTTGAAPPHRRSPFNPIARALEKCFEDWYHPQYYGLTRDVSQLEKSIQRLRARPPEADFDDVRRVLEANGWHQAGQKGSHVSFTKAGEMPFTIPLSDAHKVKRAYVQQICERLELDN